MAGGKLPPRQKMIGMMYLVLTALLAMNVSKDILTAFVIVNEGLERTNTNFGVKNNKSYQDFKAALDKDQAKTKPYYDKAMQVKKLATELVEHIEKLKKHLIKETDKIEEQAKADTMTLEYVEAKDNYDIPTAILIGSEPATPSTGEYSALELKGKIEAYRSALVKMFDDQNLFLGGVKKEMESKIMAGLALPDGDENGVPTKWEVINFFHLPIAGVVTNLSAIQASVRNAESEAVQTLLNAVKGKDFTFDKLTAKVIAPSSLLTQGDEYKADVLLVAYNSTSSPKIYLCAVDTTKNEDTDPRINKGDTGKELPVESGMGKYKAASSGIGEQKWSGVIQVEKPGGGFKYYPFAQSYMVQPPALVVSPTKMNVFYIGVDNPVDISVPGYGPESLVATISAGSISPDPAKKGSYIVKVPTGTKEATINVAVKQAKGTKQMGSGIKFRVKTIPNPVAKVQGKMNGESAPKGLLTMADGGIAAVMENFDFELNPKPVVVSFKLAVVVSGEFKDKAVSGNKFGSEVAGMLKSVKAGARVSFEEVKIKMPDGSIRNAGTVTLKVS